MKLAARAGLRWRTIEPGDEQRSILDAALRQEKLRQPEHQPDEAANDDLLGRGRWLLAETRDGRPLLQVVVLLDRNWALLVNFRTLESSSDASNARFWMTSVLADELSASGVHWLIDGTHPLRVSNGVRYFQRITGWQVARLIPAARNGEEDPST